MKEEFLKNLYLKQQQKEQVPSNKVIANWASKLICILYPEMSKCSYPTFGRHRRRIRKTPGGTETNT